MKRETKKFFGWTVLVILSLIPVFLLFAFGPGGSEFSGYAGVTQAMGEITGLVGMTIFALTFVLSTRIKWIEDVFGGLDKVYIVHGIMGGTALVLLLSHPVFLVLKFVPNNLILAATYLLPGSFWSSNFGIIALYGMILLIFITLFTKVKYHNWKFSHEFLGLVFFIAVLHIFLVRGTISKDYIFHGYYVYSAVVSAIGLSAFFYSLFIKNRATKNAVYSIKNISHRKGVWHLELSPEHKPIEYKSGQFIFIRFYNEKLSTESHPFSIASKSGSQTIKIVIKSLGDFTKKLEHLKIGDKVSIEGPYGRFHFRDKGKEQIWIAGGIGITPFLGMVEDLEKSQQFKVDLYHTVKEKEDFIGKNLLETISRDTANFRFFPWNTQENGFIKIEDVAKNSGLKNKEIFLCGPGGFKEAMTEQLLEKGVKKSNIHEEAFEFR